jgi:hypothetical protein
MEISSFELGSRSGGSGRTGETYWPAVRPRLRRWRGVGSGWLLVGGSVVREGVRRIGSGGVVVEEAMGDIEY